MNMQTFGFMLKTYANDLVNVNRLLASFQEFNESQIDLVIVCPASDRELFNHFASSNIQLLDEESIDVELAVDAINGIRPGYINQEILKLSFWRTGYFENYLCLDSDAEFIRPISINDYMRDAENPYTILHDDKDLRIDPAYQEMWNVRSGSLAKIVEHLGMDSKLSWPTCHGFQIIQSRVMKEFEKNVLHSRNLTFLDLMKISPYEFSWYNYYLQLSGQRIYQIEPLFKYFHTPYQLIEAKLNGVTKEHLSKAYCGIVMTSNFTGQGYEYSQSRFKMLARFVSLRDLVCALIYKSKTGTESANHSSRRMLKRLVGPTWTHRIKEKLNK